MKGKSFVSMGVKDISEKTLEEYNDVFADIVNVLLFDGEEVIVPESLSEATPYSNYTAHGKVRSQERDVLKYWNNSHIRLAAVGFENQTDVDDDMPIRVINYDGAGYRAQLRPSAKNKRYPVVSLVLYYSYEKRWNKAVSLYECLDIPDKLKDYVNDYRINLFEIAFLDDKKAKLFKSDFRFVVDYFIQMRKTGAYIPPDDTIIHVQEMLSLMSALTDDNRFVETYEQVKGRERVSMCNVLDEIEEKGIKKGIEQGIEKGIEQGIEQGKSCAKNEDVKSLAEYLMKEKSDLSWEEAVKMAEEILKK